MYFAIMHMDNNGDNDNNRLGCDLSPEGTGRESRGPGFLISPQLYIILCMLVYFSKFSVMPVVLWTIKTFVSFVKSMP